MLDGLGLERALLDRLLEFPPLGGPLGEGHLRRIGGLLPPFQFDLGGRHRGGEFEASTGRPLRRGPDHSRLRLKLIDLALR